MLATGLALIRELGAARWIVVATLGVTAAATILREILAHRESARATRRALERRLRCPPTKVRAADPFLLGVSPSEIANRFSTGARPPYVPRDVDAALDAALRERSLVLLVGASKAGKTRCLFEAVSRVHPERTLVAPALDTSASHELLDLAEAISPLAGDGIVLWLDDFDEFVRTRALTTKVLGVWMSIPGVVIVGTIRSQALADLRAASREGLGVETDHTLNAALKIFVETQLSDGERDSAEQLYPGEDFVDGLGVHLVAGQQLVDRYLTAIESCPEGYAVVTAAADLRRAGVLDPILRRHLSALVPTQWEEIRPHTPYTDAVLDRGIAWATESVLSDVSLLLPAGDGLGHDPFDYIVAFRDGEVAGAAEHPIDSATWAAAIVTVPPPAIGIVGLTAAAHGQPGIAEIIFAALSRSDDTELAAMAMLDLARVRLELGNEEEAVADLRACVAAGDPESAPYAAYTLGLLLQEEDPDEAEWAYRLALDSSDAALGAKAAVNLGLLIRSRAHLHSVRFRENDEPDAGGVGFFFPSGDAAPSEEQMQADEEARGLFQRALTSDDEEAVANAANALGVLEAMNGRTSEMEAAFGRGIEMGNSHAAANYAMFLAKLEGREDEVPALIERAHELAGNNAARRLNVIEVQAFLATEAEDFERAIALYREAREVSGNDEALLSEHVHATYNLAELLEQAGVEDEAWDLLEEVWESGVEPYASEAEWRLTAADE